jgi:uncharacterized protein YciI
MPDYLLFYDYVGNAVEKRRAFRREHFTLASEAIARGHLILGGAYANPVDGAVLYFRCESTGVIEEFVRSDPYVRNGLVTSWKIREWTTVVGSMAATSIRPEDV